MATPQEINAEYDRLYKLTAKKFLEETGLKFTHRAFARETACQTIISEKFSQEDVMAWLTCSIADLQSGV